jgi:hypothetical protein
MNVYFLLNIFNFKDLSVNKFFYFCLFCNLLFFLK